jgi:hypothetical protein
MGRGTDVAMQSAGITLVKGDLRGIAQARLLSQPTMRNIRENLFFAFVYKRSGGPSRRRGALSGVRAAVEPDHRQRGDEPELGVGHRQHTATAAPPTRFEGQPTLAHEPRPGTFACSACSRELRLASAFRS